MKYQIVMTQIIAEQATFVIEVDSKEDIEQEIVEMEGNGDIPWQPVEVIEKEIVIQDEL